MAHGTHHQGQISGVGKQPGAKCMPSGVQDDVLGQACLLPVFRKVLATVVKFPTFESEGNTQPFPSGLRRAERALAIRLLMGRNRRESLVFPLGTKIAPFSQLMSSQRMAKTSDSRILQSSTRRITSRSGCFETAISLSADSASRMAERPSSLCSLIRVPRIPTPIRGLGQHAPQRTKCAVRIGGGVLKFKHFHFICRDMSDVHSDDRCVGKQSPAVVVVPFRLCLKPGC